MSSYEEQDVIPAHRRIDFDAYVDALPLGELKGLHLTARNQAQRWHEGVVRLRRTDERKADGQESAQ